MLLEQHIFTNSNYSQSIAKAFDNKALVNLGLNINVNSNRYWQKFLLPFVFNICNISTEDSLGTIFLVEQTFIANILLTNSTCLTNKEGLIYNEVYVIEINTCMQ